MHRALTIAFFIGLSLIAHAQNKAVSLRLNTGSTYSFSVDDVKEIVFPELNEVLMEQTDLSTGSIDQLKEQYWISSLTGSTTIGLTPNGRQYIIIGTIVSDMSTRNHGGNLIIQDLATGTSIPVYTKMSDMIETGLYEYGRTVSINVSGMQMAYYNGAQEISASYADNKADPVTLSCMNAVTHFMETPIKVEPLVVTIAELESAKTNADGLRRYQNRLVRIENVEFESPRLTFVNNHSNTNRYFSDTQGNRCYIRTMSDATFGEETIPVGRVSVTGILSYYDGTWQIRLNNAEGICPAPAK